MNGPYSPKDYGGTSFVTGMRAFAALAVVLAHTGGAGLRELGPIGGALADLGRAGVHVFFVVSGFSVAASYLSSGGYAAYLNKRLWRIAPLFWFWIAAAMLLGVTSTFWQERFGVVPDLRSVFLHLALLSFLDYRVTNTLIGVEWSIPLEVVWYFLVPALLAVSTTRVRTIVMAVVAVIAGYTAIKNPRLLPVDSADAAIAMAWSPLPYVLSYGLGVAAFRLRPWCCRSLLGGDLAVAGCVAVIGVHVVLLGTVGRSPLNEFLLVSMVTAVLLLFGRNESAAVRWSFGLPFVQFVGVVSYGLYLCHVPVMTLAIRAGLPLAERPSFAFLFVSAVSIAVSTVTYVVLERPLMELGARLGRRLAVAKP